MNVQGEAVSVLESVPSTESSTFVTPTLSAAFACTWIVPATVPPSAGDVIETVGGVVSAGAPTVTVTEAAAELPAASYALAVIVCEPALAPVAFQVKPYGELVEVATTVPSTEKTTLLTPKVSLALAATATDPETVE